MYRKIFGGWTGVGGGMREWVVPTTGCYGFVIPLRDDLTHSVMSNNTERFECQLLKQVVVYFSGIA